MNVQISPSWHSHIHEELEKQYFHELASFVTKEYQNQTIYPPESKIFAAFEACSFDDLKVVIIGQDPYHGPGQANGLSFSVNKGIKIPPSLRNIYKELQDDIGMVPIDGDLTSWAKQGVLLLNATLTVRASTPGSHQKKGWEQFTDAIIREINDNKKGVVFLLWGAYAQKKGAIIDVSKHHILSSAHPSPFSAYRGFLGNRHFSKCNEYLRAIGKREIEW